MLIVPRSESKWPAPPAGHPVALDDLSSPELTRTRRRILAAVIETSRRPDALQRLRVGPALVHEVARNTQVRGLPARPALDVCSGTGTQQPAVDVAPPPGGLTPAHVQPSRCKPCFDMPAKPGP